MQFTLTAMQRILIIEECDATAVKYAFFSPATKKTLHRCLQRKVNKSHFNTYLYRYALLKAGFFGTGPQFFCGDIVASHSCTVIPLLNVGTCYKNFEPLCVAILSCKKFSSKKLSGLFNYYNYY